MTDVVSAAELTLVGPDKRLGNPGAVLGLPVRFFGAGVAALAFATLPADAALAGHMAAFLLSDRIDGNSENFVGSLSGSAVVVLFGGGGGVLVVMLFRQPPALPHPRPAPPAPGSPRPAWCRAHRVT